MVEQGCAASTLSQQETERGNTKLETGNSNWNGVTKEQGQQKTVNKKQETRNRNSKLNTTTATPRVSFSGLGFFRRNNVFKNKLINNLQSGNNNGNYFDARTKISSNIKNLNQNFVYGAGIDAKYSVGSRSELTLGFNGAFNHFKNYEFSLGYGFRIY